ncbi:MAG TPA: zinc-dependent metalloprotease family protein [Geminicoccaceae bacterium]|nr:zinc-dependent metalloprotease family protein [Geminicoccaceae bacterium]
MITLSKNMSGCNKGWMVGRMIGPYPLAMALFLAGVTASDAQTVKLFEPVPRTADLERSTVPDERYETVGFLRLDRNALSALDADIAEGPQSFDIPISEGEQARIELEEIKRGFKDTSIAQGHVVGEPGNTASFVFAEDLVTGNFRLGTNVYQVRPIDEDMHVVRRAVPEAFPQEAEPLDPPYTPDRRGALTPDSFDFGDTCAPEIDVLVLYTDDARAAAGSTQLIEADINLAILESNQAYEQSEITQRLALVHAEEVSFNETTNWNAMLSALQDPADGTIDGVHGLRDQYGADMVSMIIEDGQFCGLAYLWGDENSDFAPFAFSLVNRGCATGYYSFAHELGHNQGLNHDRNNAGAAIAPYAYGYQDPSGDFRTILAYNCPGGCTRVQHFSNPNVNYNGEPTGIDPNVDPANAAFNARWANESRCVAANWRDRPGIVAGTADVFATWGGRWHLSESGTSRWQQINTSNATTDDVLLADMTGDGAADVFATWGGRWHLSESGTSRWRQINTSNATTDDVLLADMTGIAGPDRLVVADEGSMAEAALLEPSAGTVEEGVDFPAVNVTDFPAGEDYRSDFDVLMAAELLRPNQGWDTRRTGRDRAAFEAMMNEEVRAQ